MSGLERFQGHLRDLFQLDTADLDFGIYRLFAARGEEVDRFIEKELPAFVDALFSDLPDEPPKALQRRCGSVFIDICNMTDYEKMVGIDYRLTFEI